LILFTIEQQLNVRVLLNLLRDKYKTSYNVNFNLWAYHYSDNESSENNIIGFWDNEDYHKFKNAEELIKHMNELLK
jgi:aspartyl/asparaginyl beta-hydroxylase (cupin superfamily)